MPSFYPVTTFGDHFEVDEILRSHLFRFSETLMVSHHYAQSLDDRSASTLPLFIDSGGFASLFEESQMIDLGDRFGIQTKDKTRLDPAAVLEFQQRHAEIGATLDFIISPGMEGKIEADELQQATIANALWALKHRSRDSKMKLYASLQAWDQKSASRITNALVDESFDGFALGGMVPRSQNPELVLRIVDSIRKAAPERPLHVFGIGQPSLMRRLFDAGVDSTDSSSFVRSAVSRRYFNPTSEEFIDLKKDTKLCEVCDCSICKTFDVEYLLLEGELHTMALALHNLSSLVDATFRASSWA